ncbi:hypothetical protein IAQ61_003083 [Plenodomus lingam]|uniref:uncharacterized protein n=1 Tax=Leptosphaeria maculans TaxID=5022 RepID=UPI00331F1A30|nr:hypothetical protein IAQ61_003083 [Plenodomus lingam]
MAAGVQPNGSVSHTEQRGIRAPKLGRGPGSASGAWEAIAPPVYGPFPSNHLEEKAAYFAKSSVAGLSGGPEIENSGEAMNRAQPSCNSALQSRLR